jgi:hypothetical protein
LNRARVVTSESMEDRYLLRSSGRVNPLEQMKAQVKKTRKIKNYSKTKGIEESEIQKKTQQESVYVVLGPRIRREPIVFRIETGTSSWL